MSPGFWWRLSDGWTAVVANVWADSPLPTVWPYLTSGGPGVAQRLIRIFSAISWLP
jgi:hypothetical protein